MMADAVPLVMREWKIAAAAKKSVFRVFEKNFLLNDFFVALCAFVPIL